MKNAYHRTLASQLSNILAALPAKTSDEIRAFVQQFYAKMPLTDMEKLKPDYAAALAVCAYDFIGTRKTGEPKIRIFTPNRKEHGYIGKHLVIELLNDDMPFLVDSLSAELTRLNLTIHETIHPIFGVARDKTGAVKTIGADQAAHDGKGESFIHFEVSGMHEDLSPKALEEDLRLVLSHIQAAVADWKKIVTKVQDVITDLDTRTKQFGAEDVAEVKDFLRWLVNRNFVFLGYAEYDFFDAKGKQTLAAADTSKLGVLKVDEDISPREMEALPEQMRQFLLTPRLIEITKSSRRSLVHRSVPMDYVGIKKFNAAGKLIGEARFLGLFTSNVYYQSAEIIPLARQKMAHVLERSQFDRASHDGKSLKTILEFLPRDEIFQMSEDDLFTVGMGILALEAKPGVRVFVRKDTFERFVSLMVFVPREQFSTDLRRQIQTVAENAFHGNTSSFATQISEAPLTRLHLIVKTTPGQIPPVDITAIEREIAKRAYLWSDLLREALDAKYDDAAADKWHRMYASAFPQNYINSHDATAAAYDIKKIDDAIASGNLVLDLFKNRNEEERFLHLKIYNPNEEIALSDILPLLENAGFRVIDEHPFHVAPMGVKHPVWVRDFKLEISQHPLDFERIKPLLEEAMLKTWQQEAENDRLNALVLTAELTWRQVAMLRAYAKYLRQAGFASGLNAIAQAFSQHAAITKHIVALFEARFDLKEKSREEKQTKLKEAIEVALSNVSNAAEDRILRRYMELIAATLRTNYFQSIGEVISFKFDSKHVPDLPLPRPFAEIFVYGTRVEGIHLRGGKVARGGLRWSDRHEDFRTEVLGLMKAQMVKNSVIVPVGSKGGFIVKKPPVPGNRELLMEEGIACYKTYLRGLLDITDNIVDGKVVPPKNVVRHDGDDPYLVVAADKGTATFSDIANGVSAEYGFWLGDAFASGGSAGYDHKAMGITARGGWVSVTRHFQEMDIDIFKQDFTCVGIGDMAGDVFGNGMLLSDHIKLVAAFNHMHIFIDPNPDAQTSFAERKRLFNLPRSSWKDYDVKLISKGGGVFERSAKTIALSKEAQAALGVTKTNYAPDDLIRAILMAPVDLLWNGGIGTYVKAEEESHEHVGDRANNALRVNGKELRCKIVGEGGNLGFTQRGRIEYARTGGRINTDAIDNSAGVDCSDHEVNIKIALAQEMASGKLTLPKRNKLLAGMTDEVARLVLKDNILQTQAITIAERYSPLLLEAQARLMSALEREGLLNRAIEFLPNDAYINELKAAKKGLTRPEIAVLLAYSKMSLYQDLLHSSLPDEPYFDADLKRYFPKPMQEEFSAAIAKHPLRREIIATVVTNSLVNRAGITFTFEMMQDMGATVRDVATAYTLVRDIFDLRGLWKEIEVNAAAISVTAQTEMYGIIYRFIQRGVAWMLRNLPLPLSIETVNKTLAPAIAAARKIEHKIHAENARIRIDEETAKFVAQAVPEKLAKAVSRLSLAAVLPDMVLTAQQNKLSTEEVAITYAEIGDCLALNSLRESLDRIHAASHWERLAIRTLINDLYDQQRRLTDQAIRYKGGISAWREARANDTARFIRFMENLKASGEADLPKMTLALRQLRTLGSNG